MEHYPQISPRAEVLLEGAFPRCGSKVQAQGADIEESRVQAVFTVEIIFAHSILGCTEGATGVAASQASGWGGRLKEYSVEVSRILAIGFRVMGKGLLEDVLGCKGAFLSPSSNFEAYVPKIVVIVLGATDLSACFIQCLTGRSCSAHISVVVSDVFMTCGEVKVSRCADVYRLCFAYSMLLY